MQGGFERKPRVSAFDSSDISKALERNSNSDGKQALRDVYECAVSKIDQVRNYFNYKDWQLGIELVRRGSASHAEKKH